jgi:hypothetical protein
MQIYWADHRSCIQGSHCLQEDSEHLAIKILAHTSTCNRPSRHIIHAPVSKQLFLIKVIKAIELTKEMYGVRKNSVPDCSTKKGGFSAPRLVQCRPSISIRINFYPYIVTSLDPSDPSSRNVPSYAKPPQPILIISNNSLITDSDQVPLVTMSYYPDDITRDGFAYAYGMS